jgi:hypothetical protein
MAFSGSTKQSTIHPRDNVVVLANERRQLIKMTHDGGFIRITIEHAPIVVEADQGFQPRSTHGIEVGLQLIQISLRIGSSQNLRGIRIKSRISEIPSGL